MGATMAMGEVTVAWGYEDLNGLSESARVTHGPLKGAWRPFETSSATSPTSGSRAGGRRPIPSSRSRRTRDRARSLGGVPERQGVPPPGGRRRARVAGSAPRLRRSPP